MSNSQPVEHREPTPAARVWVAAASGNQCAFPGCLALIMDIEHGTWVGEIAHICARRSGGPRFEPNQSEEENRSFGNLIALCGTHHRIVDDSQDRYPAYELVLMKREHELRIARDNDRGWVKPPNSIQRLVDEESVSISYWSDRSGKVQLYTARQLAVVNLLLTMNLDFSKLFEIVANLPSYAEQGLTVAQVLDHVGVFKTSAPSIYGHFAQMMASAPDITFAEFLGFIIAGNDPTPLITLGRERLRQVETGTDPDVKSWFRSDKMSSE